MINTEQTELSGKIIGYLMNKEKMRDDLEGIVLGIYDKEMKKLSERIIISLADLMAKGKIKELKTTNGKHFYQLTRNYAKNNAD